MSIIVWSPLNMVLLRNKRLFTFAMPLKNDIYSDRVPTLSDYQ